ncbi:histidinol-phosphate aminotransferase family protein [bacterium D16-54]|nr:histidinol-phosphate aminotransferase family protein [bacterium D16-54]RKJ09480.1 histidinol-phosphate aminotransferase family protein [bacterium D16-56]
MKGYVNNIKPYDVLSHDIWGMDQAEKEKCLKLDWNESTIPPSPNVYNRLKDLAQRGDFYQWYPCTHNLKLITDISRYMNVDKKNIQVFASSDVLQEYVVRCWIKREDNVLIVWPTYDNFRATAEFAGANIYYSLTQDLRFDARQLQKDIESSKPQMVYICNPNNPTGEQIDKNIIEDIVKKNKSVLFLIDEAYAEFSGKTVADLVDKYENLLVSRTFSKAFALANFRIGYLISSDSNIEMVSRVRNAKNITTFSQEAAIAALEDLEYMESHVRDVKIAREFFIGELKSVPNILDVYPSETNFVLIRLKSAGLKQKFLCFMKENNIYIRDLRQNVLLEHFVRITIGSLEQMKKVSKIIKEFCSLYHEGSSI